MIGLRDAPTGRPPGAPRHRAGTGRVALAPRCGCQGSAERACSDQRLTADVGRVVLPLTLSRHEVTLVEPFPVVDETRPRWDERRLPGREAA
ncbi:hypothetical protein [Streptomyces africanus]|uniref:hypothetical protein n=1 Tax=Streptomyces africanus TaxID=231024 RepID=UPI000A3CD951|nr:hypothetical protein [Streptomyces africanus]